MQGLAQMSCHNVSMSTRTDRPSIQGPIILIAPSLPSIVPCSYPLHLTGQTRQLFEKSRVSSDVLSHLLTGSTRVITLYRFTNTLCLLKYSINELIFLTSFLHSFASFPATKLL